MKRERTTVQVKRQSIDSSPRQSWRTSLQSTKSYISVDRGTQTEDIQPTQPRSISVASSRSLRDTVESPVENPWDTPDTSEDHDIASDSNGDCEIHDASATVATESARSVVSTPAEESPSAANFSRPRLVTIPKRIPPALPPRNPVRRRGSQSTQGSVMAGPASPSASAHGEISTAIDSSSDGEKHVMKEKKDSNEMPAEASAPETHEENTAVEKDEFHSTSTSPTEEFKTLELANETNKGPNEEAREELRSEAEKTS